MNRHMAASRLFPLKALRTNGRYDMPCSLPQRTSRGNLQLLARHGYAGRFRELAVLSLKVHMQGPHVLPTSRFTTLKQQFVFGVMCYGSDRITLQCQPLPSTKGRTLMVRMVLHTRKMSRHELHTAHPRMPIPIGKAAVENGLDAVSSNTPS